MKHRVGKGVRELGTTVTPRFTQREGRGERIRDT